MPTEQDLSPPASVHGSIDVRTLPWTRRLTADYAYDFGRVASFFAGDPRVPEAWRQAIARAQTHPRGRDTMAGLISHQQQRRGAPAAAVAAAARLRDPATVAVVTGQQAGLFGGPLFTLLKAVSALNLAARVERDHGVPCIAAFWIDSEDHDWDEVRSCGILSAGLESRSIELSSEPGQADVPIGRIRLDDSIEAALTELATLLPPTEFTPGLLEELRSAYRPGVTMADAFGRWLETVLGERGLVVFDAADPGAKPLAANLFVHEIRHAGRTAELARAAGNDLEALGYQAQVTPHEGAPGLFRLGASRQPIRAGADGLAVAGKPISADELADEAASAPHHFSPNVLLRPLVQDQLFPTVCYVPGPNELAYLAQLGTVYGHFDIPRPLLVPRDMATLLDSAAARFLARYELSFAELQPQDDGALNRLLDAQLPAAVEHSLDHAAGAIQERMTSVAESVPTIDPTLVGAVQSTLGRMERDLRTLRGKVIQAAKRRDETLRRQFTRARAIAFPGGHLQERTVGFMYFLNLYGPALVDRLVEALPVEPGRHWLLTI